MSVGSATMVQCTSTHISSLWPRVKRRTIFLDIMFRVYKQPLTRRGQRRHRAWKNLALPRHVGGGYCVNLLVWLASFSSVTQRTHAPSPAFLCTRVPSNKPKRKLVLQQSGKSSLLRAMFKSPRVKKKKTTGKQKRVITNRQKSHKEEDKVNDRALEGKTEVSEAEIAAAVASSGFKGEVCLWRIKTFHANDLKILFIFKF